MRVTIARPEMPPLVYDDVVQQEGQPMPIGITPSGALGFQREGGIMEFFASGQWLAARSEPLERDKLTLIH